MQRLTLFFTFIFFLFIRYKAIVNTYLIGEKYNFILSETGQLFARQRTDIIMSYLLYADVLIG